MAEISAGLVKELRELTGLGMMECKKALAECAGDLKKAEELLRIKSGAKASKAAGRIASAKPAYLNKAEIPQEVVADEKRIQEARAKESGKPAEIVAKMVEGAVNKFLGEKTLHGQPFVKDDKQTVERMLAAKKAKVNG